MVDRYTKAVLTVIAVALCIIAFRQAFPGERAYAAFGADQDVLIVDGAGLALGTFDNPLYVTAR